MTPGLRGHALCLNVACACACGARCLQRKAAELEGTVKGLGERNSGLFEELKASEAALAAGEHWGRAQGCPYCPIYPRSACSSCRVGRQSAGRMQACPSAFTLRSLVSSLLHHRPAAAPALLRLLCSQGGQGGRGEGAGPPP